MQMTEERFHVAVLPDRIVIQSVPPEIAHLHHTLAEAWSLATAAAGWGKR
jgi:hypothetical protein